MRVLRLKQAFFTTRRVHAPPGSIEDKGVRAVLRSLADERSPLPGAHDTETLRTPHWKLWARPVPGAALIVTYGLFGEAVEVMAVHPVWSEHR